MKLMRTLGVVLTLAGLTAAAVWWFWLRPVPIEERLSADDTVAYISFTDLESGYGRFRQNLASYPVADGLWRVLWGTVSQSRTALGFDPGHPEGWKKIGIDSDRGVALAYDRRLQLNGRVHPVLWIATDDLSKALETYKRFTGHQLTVETENSVSRATIGSRSLLYATDGGWTVATLAPTLWTDQVSKSLWLILNTKGPKLGRATQFTSACGALDNQRQLLAWARVADTTNSLEKDFGLGITQLAAHSWATRFPAVCGQTGMKNTSLRLATNDGFLGGLAQILNPNAPAPDMTGILPKGNYSFLRLSIQLPSLLDALGQLLPQSTPDWIRKGLGIARLTLPILIGQSWEQLTKAYSGHFLFAARGRSGPRKSDDDSRSPTLERQALVAIHHLDDTLGRTATASIMNALSAEVMPTPSTAISCHYEVSLFKNRYRVICMNGFTILGTSTAIADLAAGHFRKKPGESLRAALNHRSAMALWLDYQSIGSELYKDGAKPTPLSESNQVVALSVNLRPKAIELRWLAPQPPERIIRILTKKATR